MAAPIPETEGQRKAALAEKDGGAVPGVPGASHSGWAEVFLVLQVRRTCVTRCRACECIENQSSALGSSAQGAAGGESLVKCPNV